MRKTTLHFAPDIRKPLYKEKIKAFEPTLDYKGRINEKMLVKEGLYNSVK